ncbi:glutaredoxin family protein [Leucobacter manosquensis]|uniref:NrdH-redoxin n=1 Tax=Leucobacter manosquensis TaxID=2810611 RepID=A0ABS5M5B7_9MICO|nr:glutaredoxin domain-containing protein [Leucobacter manosquensis]MBS3182395.1 NrdH-redoxin [Leucobacter manosquensis]
MKTITVYTSPSCGQCMMTHKELGKRGIEYVTVGLSEDWAAGPMLREKYGYTQAPVVVVDDGRHWTGFRPDKIAGLVG